MNDGMQLQIEIRISDYQRGNGNLQLSESVMIPDGDFGTLSAILGKFHELLAEIKAAREGT
jgi:hypothetical protein